MKWLWRDTDDVDAADAERARREAEKHLEEANSKWPEVREVAESLRDLSKRNHFGEAIERIMREDGAK